MIDDARCKQAAMARALEAATVVASSFVKGKTGEKKRSEYQIVECV